MEDGEKQPETPPQPTVEQPAPPVDGLPKKTKPKWIVPAIVIAGIIILGIGAWAGYNYWLKPVVPEEQPAEEQREEKLDEFTDWKHYQDEELGLSFKYPQDWELSTRLQGHYVYKSIEGEIYGKLLTQFTAWEDFEEIEGKINFEEYVNKIKNEHLIDKNVKKFQDETILLGEKEAIKFSYEVPEREISIPGRTGVKLGEFVSEIYLRTDKGLFYLVGIAIREKDIYYPVVNQILSTFKFID